MLSLIIVMFNRKPEGIKAILRRIPELVVSGHTNASVRGRVAFIKFQAKKSTVMTVVMGTCSALNCSHDLKL